LWYSLESTERYEMKLTNITIEESLLKNPADILTILAKDYTYG